MAQFRGKLTATLTRSAFFVTVRRQTWFVFNISSCLKWNLQVTLELWMQSYSRTGE